MSKRAKRSDRANPRQERNRVATYRTDRNDRQERNNVIDFSSFKKTTKKHVEITPRTITQENLVVALADPKKHVVFAIGPAGCGKTLIATLAAIKALKAGEVEKIIITRPNVAVDDKDIGFLPGSVLEKMEPWTRPIFDVVGEYYSKQDIEFMVNEGIIEIVPIAYMRGRTFKNAMILVDEAQGTTQNSLKSILTRIGENSKIVVTGDLAQSDRGPTNGLADFVERFDGNKISSVEVVHFGRSDVQRHPVIKDILKLYGEE